MVCELIYGIRSLIELIYGIRSLIELIYGIRSFSVKIVTFSLLVHKNT